MNLPAAPAPAARRCPTVLVVDDFAAICDLIAWHLSATGYRVLTASDPSDVERIVRSKTGTEIDLLLTDVQMPKLRGDKLAEWFCHECPQARVLFMSANRTSLPDKMTTSFLEKPFSLEALNAAVRQALTAEAGVASALAPAA